MTAFREACRMVDAVLDGLEAAGLDVAWKNPGPGAIGIAGIWQSPRIGWAVKRVEALDDGDSDWLRLVTVRARCWRVEREHPDGSETFDPWSKHYAGRGWRERMAADIVAAAIKEVNP